MKNKRLIKYILMSFIVLFFTTFIAVIIENDTNSKQNEKINDEISKIINVFVDQYFCRPKSADYGSNKNNSSKIWLQCNF